MLKAYIANKGLLIRPDGKCLFLRDSGLGGDHASSKGLWDFPGGRMEEDEMNFLLSLKRELIEEIGFNKGISFDSELLCIRMWKNGNEEYICGNFWVLRVRGDFAPVLSEEHDEYRWEFPSEMKSSKQPTFGSVIDEYDKKYTKDA
jgi:8-oxo-dGTP pyrophosphatase MutT (NUDIX family)